MYECWDCGERFRSPSLYKERNTYGDWEREEYFGKCPFCGSDNYDIVFRTTEDKDGDSDDI